MFAILELRADALVIVKCAAELVPVLLETYTGVGHRSHLDRRFWVCVKLDADVPAREVKRLIEGSYDLVCAGLTRKQQLELSARRAAPRAARDRPRSA